jgi:hypothetical protein
MEAYLDSVTESFLEGDYQLSHLSVSPSVIESDDSWNLGVPESEATDMIDGLLQQGRIYEPEESELRRAK